MPTLFTPGLSGWGLHCLFYHSLILGPAWLPPSALSLQGMSQLSVPVQSLERDVRRARVGTYPMASWGRHGGSGSAQGWQSLRAFCGHRAGQASRPPLIQVPVMFQYGGCNPHPAWAGAVGLCKGGMPGLTLQPLAKAQSTGLVAGRRGNPTLMDCLFPESRGETPRAGECLCSKCSCPWRSVI